MALSWRTWTLVYTVFLYFTAAYSEIQTQQTQTFIVRVENELKPSEFPTVEDWYSSTLKTLRSTNLLHIYKTVFHGFSAKLTPEQARELRTWRGILGVFPDRVRQIHTTRSPHFLGLDTAEAVKGLIGESYSGSNVIIGFLDTGIWPERHSFHGEDMEPVPSRWKGECVEGELFPKRLCNKKLIGARYFNNGYKNSVLRSNDNDPISARDTLGHGTHTASTAAGRATTNASLFGFASGLAAGIAQKARIAMYKVCWEYGCMESDILAGFDAAVHDGVDVVSISLGPGEPLPYENDVVAIASFGAMERGVFVSAAAGNLGSVTNIAPWITTVGASTIDRKFAADLYLGDGTVISGSSLYNGDCLANTYWPLIYAGNASLQTSGANACFPDSIDPKLVRGKIVVCDPGLVTSVTKGLVVKKAGGVGTVVPNFPQLGEGLVAEAYLTPALTITESARTKLLAYIRSAQNSTARMAFRGTQIGTKPAPVVASFSSRGPNQISINVMKPDLVAPGVDILAAYPDDVPPSDSPEDPRSTEFNIESGTSMACPHVSGIAALLKGARPKWSPAMIRSALMTTAYTHDQDGKTLLDEKDLNVADAWSMGAGHVDPVKALHPGLVYDLTVDDHLNFLCGSNFSLAQIKMITRRAVNCSEARILNPWDLNYPAISIAFNASRPYDSEVAVRRTVTNVGNATTNYTVAVTNPKGVITTVDPQILIFNQKGEKKSYTVRIAADNGTVSLPPNSMQSEFGQLSWTDGKHLVNSPIIITWFNSSN